MLEIAQLSTGLTVIAQRGSAGLNRLVQHLPDDRHKRADAGRGYLTGLAFRREARAVKDFADVDIAKARDDALVEQR